MVGGCCGEEFWGGEKSEIGRMEGVNVDWEVEEERNSVRGCVSELKGKYGVWYMYWNNGKGEKE